MENPDHIVALDELSKLTPDVIEAVKSLPDHPGEAKVKALDVALPEVHMPKIHPWLHPTKGWREKARQTKTNRRRKLSDAGRAGLAQAVIDDRARRVRERDEAIKALVDAGMRA
jgi:hypothetical protein